MKRRLIGSLFALTVVVWSSCTFVGRGSSHSRVKARCVTRRAEKDAFNKQILGRFWTKRCHSCVFVFCVVYCSCVFFFFPNKFLGIPAWNMAKEILAALWIWLPIFARLQEPDQSSEQPCAYFRSLCSCIFPIISSKISKNLSLKVEICLERNEQIWWINYESYLNRWKDSSFEADPQEGSFDSVLQHEPVGSLTQLWSSCLVQYWCLVQKWGSLGWYHDSFMHIIL